MWGLQTWILVIYNNIWTFFEAKKGHVGVSSRKSGAKRMQENKTF